MSERRRTNKDVDRGPSKLYQFVRAVWRIYNQKDLPSRAKALAFVTLTSMIPFLVIVFSVLNLFVPAENYDTLKRVILENLIPGTAPPSLEYLLDLVRSARGALLSGLGLVVLIWAIWAIFGNIEHAFHSVWGWEAGNPSSWRRLPEYIAFSLVLPLLVLGSLDMFGSILTLPMVSGVISRFIARIKLLSPLFALPVATLFFFLLYTFILRKRNQPLIMVNDLIGAAFAGLSFTIIKWLFVLYTSKIIHLDEIYGPLALVVILAFWTYISWIIILLGLVVSYVYRHFEHVRFPPDDEEPLMPATGEEA